MPENRAVDCRGETISFRIAAAPIRNEWEAEVAGWFILDRGVRRCSEPGQGRGPVHTVG
jgi:hypothetical protein